MPFSPRDLEMFRILKMRTEQSDIDYKNCVTNALIDSYWDRAHKALDLLWLFVALAILFWIVDRVWIFGSLMSVGWFVNLAVKQYIRRRLNSR
jgi:hypothetical protein